MSAGIRWTAPTQIAVQVGRIASVLVLTRLLTPEQFGIVALVTVVTGFFERVLGDTGTTVAVVRNPRLSQGLASSVLYWNIFIGAVTAGSFLVFGDVIASWLGDASAGDLLRVLGLLAVVNGFFHVPNALFRRHLQFSRLAAVNLTNATVTGIATIAMAIAGWGEWALVAGTLVGSFVATLVAWALVSWRPSWYFSFAEMSTISRFSANLSVQNIFGYAAQAGDRFIIGRFVGTADLGFYGLANRLMRYPVQTTAQTYKEVVFPNLAKIQDSFPQMAQVYARSVSGIAFIVFPICATVAAVADPLVGVALGPAWAETTSILGLIAVTSAIQAVASTTGSLYLARGRADLLLRWQVFSSIVLVIAYSVGARWGLVGVAWGFLLGTAVLTPLAFAIPLRLIDARMRDALRGTVGLAVAATIAALGSNLVVRLLAAGDNGDLVQLLAGSAVSVGIFAALVVLFRPAVLDDFIKLLRR